MVCKTMFLKSGFVTLKISVDLTPHHCPLPRRGNHAANEEVATSPGVKKHAKLRRHAVRIHFGKIHFKKIHFGKINFGGIHFERIHFGKIRFGKIYFGKIHFGKTYFGTS